MNWRHALLALTVGLAVAAGPAPCLAQGDLDLLKDLDKETATKPKAADPFQALDAAVTEAPKKEDALADQLAKNLSGRLRVRGIYFFQDAQEREGADLRRGFGEVLLRFSDWVGGKSWRADVSGWAEGGTQVNTYAGVTSALQDTDNRRKYLEVNELFLTLNHSDYSVTLGKKIFSSGLSTLYSPSDRLKPKDGNDPLDQKDLGIWQARVDYFRDQVTFTAAVLPVFQPSKQPSDTSRWMGSRRSGDASDFDFGDTSKDNITEDRAQINLNNTGYFARAKGTYSGWDLFFSFYHGPNPYYVLREENQGGTTVRVKETVKVGNYALGFSTTHKKWEFHGEALFNYSYDGKDDTYISYLGGATYTVDDLAKKVGLEQVELTLEYGGEGILRGQHAEGYTQSSRNTRLGKNDLYARANFKYSEDFSVEYGANFELSKSESGRYQKLETRYRVRNGLIWKVAGEMFNGDDKSYYGRWYRNDRVTSELEYSF